MKKMEYSLIEETVCKHKLENGLEVYIIPKNDFTKTTVYFATKFGSLHSGLKVNDGKEEIIIPGGLAHFIEHRIFDNKKGPVMDRFSALGASCNAYTSYNRTAYHFKNDHNINACIELLLDFVQEFTVKAESVEKEKDIIIEELRMYLDYPSTNLYLGLLNNLYFHHPIKEDVGGSEKDVKETTCKALKAAYRQFYHPENMILVICGKVNPDLILKNIIDNQSQKVFPPYDGIPDFTFEEPLNVVKEFSVQKFHVSLDKVAFGVKLAPLVYNNVIEYTKQCYLYEILLDLIFSISGKYYEEWLKMQIITNSLAYSHLEGKNYNSIIITADVYKRDIFIEYISKIFKAVDNYLPKEEDFTRIKKAKIGSFIKSLNHPSVIARELVEAYMDEREYFETMEIIQSITYHEIINLAKQISDKPFSVNVLTGGKND